MDQEEEDYDETIVKEEPIDDSECDNTNETAHQEEEVDDNIPTTLTEAENIERMRKSLNKAAYREKKRELARIIIRYPCLWDESHEFYGNREKRLEEWRRVAEVLNLSVFDSKVLWKNLMDTHRYLIGKTRNQMDFDPNVFRYDQYDVMKNLAFLNHKNKKFRAKKIVTKFERRHLIPDPLVIVEAQFAENPMPMGTAQSKEIETKTVQPAETAAAITMASSSSSITSSDCGKDAENFGTNTLKHIHIWVQIEKLFENLDDDQITDLNFLFISETYKAILEKRQNK